MQENEHIEELDTTFKDNTGRNLTVRINVMLANEFMADEGIKYGGFTLNHLTQAQLLTLAYKGTRWNTVEKAKPSTFEEFVKRLCDDLGNPTEAYSNALFAASQAVVNFTLRSTLPPSKLAEGMRLTREAQEGFLKTALGQSATSTPSAPEPDTTQHHAV